MDMDWSCLHALGFLDLNGRETRVMEPGRWIKLDSGCERILTVGPHIPLRLLAWDDGGTRIYSLELWAFGIKFVNWFSLGGALERFC
jgi:hypothetical protein